MVEPFELFIRTLFIKHRTNSLLCRLVIKPLRRIVLLLIILGQVHPQLIINIQIPQDLTGQRIWDNSTFGCGVLGDESLHFLSELFIRFNEPLMITLPAVEAFFELSMVVIGYQEGQRTVKSNCMHVTYPCDLHIGPNGQASRAQTCERPSFE